MSQQTVTGLSHTMKASVSKEIVDVVSVVVFLGGVNKDQ